MAKTVALTVKVDDKEFKDFTKNFDALSEQIKGLSDKFKNITQSVEKTAKQSEQLQGAMRGLLDITKNIHTSVNRITTHFGKWATLISGVTMALGAGAGMWGIDRFARSMMQTRRMLMVGGSDAASAQAMLRAGQITSESPEATRLNIARGQAGAEGPMRALMGLGIYDKTKKPEEVYENLLKRLDTLIPTLTKGFELPQLKAYGLGELMSEQEMLRHIGPEGREARQQTQKELKKQAAPIGKDALTAWKDLHLAYTYFTENLKNRLAERLAPVAEFLTKVADGLSKMVVAMGKWETFQQVFNDLKKWAEKFYTFLYGKDIVKAWQSYFDKLGKFFTDPKWDTFKTLLSSWVDLVGTVIQQIRTTIVEQIRSLLGRLLPEWIRNRLGLGGGEAGEATRGLTGEGAPGTTVTPGQQPAAPPAQVPILPPPNIPTIPIPGSTGSQSFLGGGSQFASLASAMQGGNQFSSFRGGDVFGGGGGGNTLLARGGDRFASWSGAANAAAPGSNVTGLAFGGGAFTQNNQFGGAGGRGPGGRGGLDLDQWQLSRTASLRIDNTPGSNFNTSAVGMSG